MTTPREQMVEVLSEALVLAQTGGLCRFGKVCDLCDCFADEDGGKARDAHALNTARHQVDALAAKGLVPQIEWGVRYEASRDLVIEYGVSSKAERRSCNCVTSAATPG